MFEIAVRGTKDDNEGSARGLMSADGSFSRRGSVSNSRKAQELAALRDVAAAITLICGLATFMIEPAVAPGAATWEPLYREFDRDWKTVHDFRTVRQVFFMIVINVASNLFMFLVVSARPPSIYASIRVAVDEVDKTVCITQACPASISLRNKLWQSLTNIIAFTTRCRSCFSLGLIFLHLRPTEVCNHILRHMVDGHLRSLCSPVSIWRILCKHVRRHSEFYTRETHLVRNYGVLGLRAARPTGIWSTPLQVHTKSSLDIQGPAFGNTSWFDSGRLESWPSCSSADQRCRNRVPANSSEAIEVSRSGRSRVSAQAWHCASASFRQMVRVCAAA